MYIGNLKVMRWVGSLIYNVNVERMHQKSPDQLLSLPELDVQEKIKAPLITRAEMEEIKNWVKNN